MSAVRDLVTQWRQRPDWVAALDALCLVAVGAEPRETRVILLNRYPDLSTEPGLIDQLLAEATAAINNLPWPDREAVITEVRRQAGSAIREYFEGRKRLADEQQRRILTLFSRMVRVDSGQLSISDRDLPWDEAHVAAFGSEAPQDVVGTLEWWGINRLEWQSRRGYRYYRYDWRWYDATPLLQSARSWEVLPDPQRWVQELAASDDVPRLVLLHLAFLLGWDRAAEEPSMLRTSGLKGAFERIYPSQFHLHAVDRPGLVVTSGSELISAPGIEQPMRQALDQVARRRVVPLIEALNRAVDALTHKMRRPVGYEKQWDAVALAYVGRVAAAGEAVTVAMTPWIAWVESPPGHAQEGSLAEWMESRQPIVILTAGSVPDAVYRTLFPGRHNEVAIVRYTGSDGAPSVVRPGPLPPLAQQLLSVLEVDGRTLRDETSIVCGRLFPPTRESLTSFIWDAFTREDLLNDLGPSLGLSLPRGAPKDELINLLINSTSLRRVAEACGYPDPTRFPAPEAQPPARPGAVTGPPAGASEAASSTTGVTEAPSVLPRGIPAALARDASLDSPNLESMYAEALRRKGWSDVGKLDFGPVAGGEFDIVALSPEEALLVEIKSYDPSVTGGTEKVGMGTVYELKGRVEQVRKIKPAAIGGRTIRARLVSTRGFSPEARTVAKEEGIELVNAPHLLRELLETGVIGLRLHEHRYYEVIGPVGADGEVYFDPQERRFRVRGEES